MDANLTNLGKLPRIIVSIAPQRHDPGRLTTDRCVEVVSSSQVRARGWYFPHISQSELLVGEGGRYVQGSFDGGLVSRHIEEWRFNQSGQFLFRMMLWEAADQEVQASMRQQSARWDLDNRRASACEGFVSFVALIYSVAEAYTFASRLAQAVPYDAAIDITIKLRGVRRWALASSDPGVILNQSYMASIDSPQSLDTVPLDTLIAAPLEAAVAAARILFQQFGWLNPGRDMIANWQRQLFQSQV